MSLPSRAALARLCRRRLEHWQNGAGHPLPRPFDEVVNELCRIVEHNSRSGRFARVARHQRGAKKLTPARYVDRVIERWLNEEARVRRLAAYDNAEWQQFGAELQQAAARMLSRYPPHSAAQDADDFAQRACEKILESQYPFDVPFAAWTRRILKNLIYEQRHKREPLEREAHDSLDEIARGGKQNSQAHTRADKLMDTRAHAFQTLLENRDLLARALRRLRSDLQRQVIALDYIQELDDAEIGQQLGKTIANVQVLRHRALENLRKILDVQVKEKRHRKR